MVAAALVVVHFLDLFWLVAPAILPTISFGYALDLILSLAATVGIGGLWAAAFVRELKSNPLVPLHDPALEAALAHHHEHDHGEVTHHG